MFTQDGMGMEKFLYWGSIFQKIYYESTVNGNHLGKNGRGYWTICPDIPGMNGQVKTI